MHLAARILLPFGLPEKKVETTAQSHTYTLVFDLLSVCASLYICICLRAAADTLLLQSVVAWMTRRRRRRLLIR